MFQEVVFVLVALSIIFVMALFGLTLYWRKLLAKDDDFAGGHSSRLDRHPGSSR